MKLLLYLFSPGHPASGARSAVGRPQVDAASVRQGRVRAGAWPLRQALAVRRRPLRPRLPATASRHLEGRRSSTRPEDPGSKLLQEPQPAVNLGSSRLCVARFFHTTTIAALDTAAMSSPSANVSLSATGLAVAELNSEWSS
jgi:hypothetical protein